MNDVGHDLEALNCGNADLDSARTMSAQSVGVQDAKSGDGDKSDNVHVAIRVRPLNARELACSNDFRFSWNIDSTTITQTLNSKPIAANSYTFDNVFQPPADNAHIFQTVASDVVKSAVEGVNGVIFAYGQTAAGKTYTMLGNQKDPGVTRRAISSVFELVGASPSRQFILRAMYIEIYNEAIRDLLVPTNDNLKIHEDAINKRVVVDAREVVVNSVEQVMQIIAAGEEVRAYGETDMNDRSSRSHTIFSLKIESIEMTAADARQQRRTMHVQSGQDCTSDSDSESETDDASNDGVAVRVSTLSLVDLAGSERASFTKAQGQRLVEGGHINKSLLTLGNVINKLSSTKSRSLAHIPYRDSKLTRLLQPALGGNARTAIICAVTPAVLHMDETLSTLKFASRAMKVTNSAKTNEFLDDRAKLRRAEKRIAELEAQIKANGSSPLRQGEGGSIARLSSTPAQSSAGRIRKFEKAFGRLLEAVNRTGSELSPTTSPLRKKHRKSHETNRLSALHLIIHERPEPEAKDSLKPSVGSEVGRDLIVDDKEKADLRTRMFEAEKQRRQAFNEIRYERELMANEVAELISQIEEISRQRDLAERECGEAYTAVARATCVSLVDEVVTGAMDTSLLRSDLQNSSREISRLKSVSERNNVLQEKLTSVQQDNTELKRRERQGVGPVLKECRKAQSKLADVENKLRSAKQSATSFSSEKARLERELKMQERTVKSLTTRLEQLQKRDESRTQARIDRAVCAVRKEAAAEIATLSKSIEQLTEKLSVAITEKETTETQLFGASEKFTTLTREYEVAKEKNAELKSEVAASVGELSTLRTDCAKLRNSLAETEQQLQNSSRAHDEASRKVEQLQEDLCSKQAEMLKIDGENAELLVQRSSLSAKAETLESELRVVKNELEESRSRTAASFADASQWEARAGMERSRREKEENLRADAEQECTCMRAELERVKCLVRQTQSDLDGANHKISEIQHENSALSTDKRFVEQCEREAKFEICNLRREMTEMRTLLNEANESSQRKDIEAKNVRADLSKRIEVLTKNALLDEKRAIDQVATAEESKNQAEMRLAQLHKALSASKTSVEESEMSLSQTKAKLEKLEVAHSQLSTKLEAKEMRLRVVETELQRRVAETDTTKEESRRMRNDIEYLSKNAEERKQEICRLLEEKIRCEQELLDACEKIKSRDDKLFQLEKRLEDITKGEGEVKLLRERLHRRTRTIKDITQQLVVMQGKLEQEPNIEEKVVFQLAEAEGKITFLMDENDTLKRRVTERDEELRKCKDLIRRTQLRRVKLTEQQQKRRIASSQKHLHYLQSATLFATPSSLVMSTPSQSEILRERDLNVDHDEFDPPVDDDQLNEDSAEEESDPIR